MKFLPIKKLDLGLDKSVRVVPEVYFKDVGVSLLDRHLSLDGRILRGELGVIMSPPCAKTIDYYDVYLKWAAKGIKLYDISKI